MEALLHLKQICYPAEEDRSKTTDLFCLNLIVPA